MKILQIVPTYKPAYIYGGPIESISKLSEGLAAEGNIVHVFTTTGNGKVELDVNIGIPIYVDGVLVYYFRRNTKDPSNISFSLWVHLFKTAKDYDIIHIQSWWNLLVIGAAFICHLKKVKFVFSPRGMLSGYIFSSGKTVYKKILHKLIGEWILSKSIFHATSEAEYIECKNLIKDWKGFIEPNVLTLPSNNLVERKNPVFSMIFMSRIHPKKGLELLFEALSELEGNFILKIAGSGDEEYLSELKNLAIKLKIEKNISWLGWLNREAKFNELMNSDLMVLVSQNENFANVVVEALHMGTPVLISEHVGLSKFVRENNLGWVAPLNETAILKHLRNAIEDKAKRLWVNLNGRVIIDQKFSPRTVINNYISAYDATIKNERSL
jgi:glycosyltransferase involved in cell wall biosynthesis